MMLYASKNLAGSSKSMVTKLVNMQNLQNLMPFIWHCAEFLLCVTEMTPHYGITFAHARHGAQKCWVDFEVEVGSTLRLNKLGRL
jgi:hypothetical protein